MKTFCYLGIIKEGFSASSSPLMLISRKVTKDKRAITDFNYSNVRIPKEKYCFLLLKDTFSMLRSSRCHVFSALDLKDEFHLLRLFENSYRFCGILNNFLKCFTSLS